MNRNPDEGIDQAAPAGYAYFVNDEQLADYGKLSLLERLTRLDQARQFVLRAEADQIVRRRARLRNEGTAPDSPER